MTETANLALKAGGSITGFNEPTCDSARFRSRATWAMLGLGFGGLALAGWSRSRKSRLGVLRVKAGLSQAFPNTRRGGVARPCAAPLLE